MQHQVFGRPEGRIRRNPFSFPGAHSEGETPDPIPNSEAKPLSADGTAVFHAVGE